MVSVLAPLWADMREAHPELSRLMGVRLLL